MLTLILSLLVSVVVWGTLLYAAHWMNIWAVLLAVAIGIGGYIGAMLLLRRRITAIMGAIQSRITERNTVLTRKYQQLGSRGGHPRHLMELARKDQAVIIAEALENTRRLEPYCRWIPLLDRQINAIRIQFLYQLKKFEEVDKLLPRTLMADPLLCCMKMCREYQRGDEAALKKTYNKYRKKFKVEATLIYSTYAWMLLRKKRVEEARQVLVDGKKATENEVIEQNWDHVTNGRPDRFSNAALGESWYALLLEEPKIPKQRIQRSFR
jgi:hypothetical protein